MLLMFNAFSTHARAQYTLYLDSVKNVCTANSIINISLRCKNFNSTAIMGYQGTIIWDTTVLQYDSLSYGISAIALNASSSVLDSVSVGKFAFLWYDGSAAGVGQKGVDTSVLATLRFKVKKLITGNAILSFDSSANAFISEAISIYDKVNNSIPASSTAYLSGNVAFTACPVSPSITSFTPTSTCPGTSATVFITGREFIGVNSITIGGKAVDSFKVNSPTSIIAYVGANQSGSIVIANSIGTGISTTSFTNYGGFSAYAYIPNRGSLTVSVLNTTTNKVITNIKVGNNPFGVSVSPDASKVYVTNYTSGTVSVINTSTNKVTATITVGVSPIGISTTPDGSKIYVANWGDNTVSVINALTNSITKTILVGKNPTSLCIGPDGSNVYVANTSDNTLSVINTVTNSVNNTVGVGYNPNGVSITPDGTKVYVTNYLDSTVSVVNTNTNLVIATIAVGNYPNVICFSPDGMNGFVPFNHGINIINTATNSVIDTLTIGNAPTGVSITPDGKTIYLADNDGSVNVIDVTTKLIKTKVSIGFDPTPVGNFIANVPTSCYPLSVNITNISAANKNGAVAVNWNTATELNTSHFIVQHSTDGSLFTDIGSVKAIGSGANKYLFTDNAPTNGINYYRLKSVDNVSTVSYSKVVSVQYTVYSNQLSVYPNPSKDNVIIGGSHIASVQVINNLGRVIKTQTLQDATNPTLSVASLPVGIYHLRVQTIDGKINSVGFVKQ